MTRAVLAEERYREGLAILIDHSETRWSRLSAQDARRRVQLLERQAEQIGRQRVAFVVSGAADFGVGRMLTLLVEGRADIESRIFYSADDARAWLRQRYLRLRELVHGAVEPGDVELAARVLAEPGRLRDLALLPHVGQRAAADDAAPDRAGAEVAEDVAARERGHGAAAIDVAARDGAAGAPVLVDVHRLCERPRPDGLVLELRVALVDRPAEVEQRLEGGVRHVVDLLPRVLTDVADPEVVGLAVEGEAPRVAQAEPDHLPDGLCLRDVESEQLPELRPRVLRAVAGIAAGAAVAVADVQLPVGAELELASVVIRERLLDVEDRLRGARQQRPAVRPVADDARVAESIRVRQVDEVVPAIAGVEGQRQQPALAPARDLRGDVREDAHLGAGHRRDLAALPDDVDRAGLAGRHRHVERAGADMRDGLKLDRRAARGRVCERGGHGEERREQAECQRSTQAPPTSSTARAA